jgi:hypothetical protein
MEQQKAAKVYPPVLDPEPGIIEVNMTTVYTTLGLLTATTAGLSITTAYLWRKTRRNEEYLEAIREYVSRLVTETKCGNMAYTSIVDGAAEEDALEDTVDWSDEVGVYPEEEEEATEKVIRRRARDIRPNV